MISEQFPCQGIPPVLILFSKHIYFLRLTSIADRLRLMLRIFYHWRTILVWYFMAITILVGRKIISEFTPRCSIKVTSIIGSLLRLIHSGMWYCYHTQSSLRRLKLLFETHWFGNSSAWFASLIAARSARDSGRMFLLSRCRLKRG